MVKPFADIQTDAEYLRAVGFDPEINLDFEACDVCDGEDIGEVCPNCGDKEKWRWTGPPLALHDTDPSRKWDNIANVLRVLGPEMDRRGFSHECFIENLTHTDLLEAFYNAHGQGDTA